MNIFWCGGEDIDFPISTSGVSVNTSPTSYNAQLFRPAYSRCSLTSNVFTNPAQSLPFSAGTSPNLWFSFWLGVNSSMTPGDYKKCWLCGVAAGDSKFAGVWVGLTDLGQMFVMVGDPIGEVSEGDSTIAPFLNGLGVSGRVCVQLYGLGTSAVGVNLYWNSTLIASTGFSPTDLLVGWATPTNLCLAISGGTANTNWVTSGGPLNICGMSEFIVADSDLRACSLATLTPTGAGTTDQWTGSYTGTNSITINDSSPIFTATAAQVEEFTLSSPPPGSYSVLGTKIAARCAVSLSSPVNNVQLGFNQSGTVAVGADQTPAVPYGTFEQLNSTTNPVTGEAWQQSDLIGLQVAIKSET